MAWHGMAWHGMAWHGIKYDSENVLTKYHLFLLGGVEVTLTTITSIVDYYKTRPIFESTILNNPYGCSTPGCVCCHACFLQTLLNLKNNINKKLNDTF